MPKPRLLDRVRDAIRLRHYSLATEKAYVSWVRRLILFHGMKHPAEMEKPEVEAFLTYLASKRNVSPSTQNQALQAILFLFRHVLGTELPWLDEVVRAKPKRRVPVVLSREEIRLIIENTPPAHRLPISLMYGAGLRVTECLRLRVGDLDFSRHTIRIHAGKGGKDRVTVLPDNLEEALNAQVACVRLFHDRDVSIGMGCAKLPFALQRKLGTSSSRLYWQYLFPSTQISEDPLEPGKKSRWHVQTTTMRKAIASATAWPQGPENNNDLHACGRARRAWCTFTTGPLIKN